MACPCFGRYPYARQVSGHEFTRAEECHLEFVILSGAPGEPYALLDEWARSRAASGNSLERLSAEPHFASPMFGQVLPARVGFFNQRDLYVTIGNVEFC